MYVGSYAGAGIQYIIPRYMQDRMLGLVSSTLYLDMYMQDRMLGIISRTLYLDICRIVCWVWYPVHYTLIYAGSYAGAGIQYIIPVSLVWLARRRLTQLEQQHTHLTLGQNRHNQLTQTLLSISFLKDCGNSRVFVLQIN